MPAGIIVIPPYMPARNRNGRLSAGALLEVREDLTTTKATVYSDEALTTPLANPVAANSSGQFPLIWADAGTTEEPVLYTLAVCAADGSSLGNPAVFSGWQPSLDADVANAALSAQDAQVAADALDQINSIVADSPDAPSVVNKANKNFDNTPEDASENLLIALADNNAAAAATKPSVFQIMNQVPSLLSYTGGAISANATLNTAAMNAMLVDMGNRGRAECKMPAGEVPVTGKATSAADNVNLHGGGSSGTTLVQGSTTNCATLEITGSFNRVENLGIFDAGGAATGSLIKVTGEQFTPFELRATGGQTTFEITDLGSMVGGVMRLFDGRYSCFHAHDGVQDIYLNMLEMACGSQSLGTGGLLRATNFVSAFNLDSWTALGGFKPIHFDAVTAGNATQPAYSVLANGYLDGFAQSGTITKSKLISFPTLWVSGGRTGSGFDGLVLDDSNGISMPNAKLCNNGYSAVRVKANCKYFDAPNIQAHCNGQYGSAPAVVFEAGCSDFNSSGFGSNDADIYSGGNQSYLYVVTPGSSDRYRLVAQGPGGTSGKIFDGGTGVNKSVLSY